MGVFREVAIDWKGRTYHVTPSNKLLRRIEMEGISIAGLVNDFQKGEPKLFCVAYVMAVLLQSAKANVTEDDVAAVLMGSQDEAKVMTLLETFITAIVPGQDSVPGNEAAPSETRTASPTA